MTDQAGVVTFGYQFAWAAAHIGFMPDCGEWGFWSSGGGRSSLLTDRGCACGRKIGIAPDRHWHDSEGECHNLERCYGY